jgi:hypothetical protein
MFSYYGTKARLAPHYPVPIYDTIIEPFAGAAGYSCLYPDRKVKLFDANIKIVAVWAWLIEATTTDVLSLPVLEVGQSVRDFKTLIDAERWLIGFCINPASTTPKITASKRSAWPRYRERIAQFVPQVKHWVVELKSWIDVPNELATWHIDPPYQVAGKYYYGHSDICFDLLGCWSKSRTGQVMVCENQGADWLPFRPLVEQQGMSKRQVEVIWENNGK